MVQVTFRFFQCQYGRSVLGIRVFKLALKKGIEQTNHGEALRAFSMSPNW